MIAERASLSGLHFDVLNRTNRQARLTYCETVYAGGDVSDYKVAFLIGCRARDFAFALAQNNCHGCGGAFLNSNLAFDRPGSFVLSQRGKGKQKQQSDGRNESG